MEVKIIIDNKERANQIRFFDFVIKYANGTIKVVKNTLFKGSKLCESRECFLYNHEIRILYELIK